MALNLQGVGVGPKAFPHVVSLITQGCMGSNALSDLKNPVESMVSLFERIIAILV